MPVKRRNAKRRVDPEREYLIWSAIFAGGRDFFDELQELGLPAQRSVDPELAREPWHRLGRRWLDDPDNLKAARPVWAERHFGRPWEETDAR